MSERDDITEQAFHTPEVVVTEAKPSAIELGGEQFSPEQWDVVVAYARGYAESEVRDASMYHMVRDFHYAFGQPVGERIQALPEDRVAVRVELIREEFEDELIPALQKADIVETVDAAVDILYVTFGLLVEMGIDPLPYFLEVQRSNMSKLGEDGLPIVAGENDPDGIFPGRVKKGPHYFRPDIAGMLVRQMKGEAI
jgi:hypothetical protein